MRGEGEPRQRRALTPSTAQAQADAQTIRHEQELAEKQAARTARGRRVAQLSPSTDDRREIKMGKAAERARKQLRVVEQDLAQHRFQLAGAQTTRQPAARHPFEGMLDPGIRLPPSNGAADTKAALQRRRQLAERECAAPQIISRRRR